MWRSNRATRGPRPERGGEEGGEVDRGSMRRGEAVRDGGGNKRWWKAVGEMEEEGGKRVDESGHSGGQRALHTLSLHAA